MGAVAAGRSANPAVLPRIGIGDPGGPRPGDGRPRKVFGAGTLPRGDGGRFFIGGQGGPKVAIIANGLPIVWGPRRLRPVHRDLDSS